jgi:hypothetical protein
MIRRGDRGILQSLSRPISRILNDSVTNPTEEPKIPTVTIRSKMRPQFGP